MRRLLSVLALVGGISLAAGAPAVASDCESGAEGVGSIYVAQMTCATAGSESASQVSHTGGDVYYTAYRAIPMCFIQDGTGGQTGGCPRSAPDACLPGSTLYQLQGLHDGTWENLGQF